jgi:hypothetical protein
LTCTEKNPRKHGEIAAWDLLNINAGPQGTALPYQAAGYRVPRFSDVPAIDVVLVDRPDIPSAGAGETPLIAVAPAVGNAIFAATGRRLRALPLVPAGQLARGERNEPMTRST